MTSRRFPLGLRCGRAPLGWWCSRPWTHEGPCALRPLWWNWTRFARAVRGRTAERWR